MTQFEIFTDSSANLPDELRERYDIKIIPYTILVDGKERTCQQEGNFRETAKKFYEAMADGSEVKTSLLSEQTIVDALTPSLAAGKDVLLITIASGISGTHRQALEAQKQLEKAFPDRKVYVADSANASMGEGLLVLKAATLRAMGESIETCHEWVENNAYQMNSYFTVDDLKYLRKGGRISATLAIAGSLLNIKPILRADGSSNAKLAFAGKERGRRKALSALVKEFKENAVHPELQTVAITHANCEEDAISLAETLKTECGVKDVIIEYYDLCTGTHAGPGTIALFFQGKDRRGDTAEQKAPIAHRVPAKKPIT
jgi:DegV family protein with EDD domain